MFAWAPIPPQYRHRWAASSSPSCCWSAPRWRWPRAWASASTARATSASPWWRTPTGCARRCATSAASCRPASNVARRPGADAARTASGSSHVRRRCAVSPSRSPSAVAGLGTVGGGVLKLLRDNADIVAARAGRPIAVTAVSARDRTRDRGVPLSGLRWYDDPVALAADPAVDVVVELIGGSDGPARALVEAAHRRRQAAWSPRTRRCWRCMARQLAALAEERGVPLAFEAAVAGGIPVIKALREGLAANRISRIAGILNGTCNYILTQMRERGREFAEVLADAQKLGYAEADPSLRHRRHRRGAQAGDPGGAGVRPAGGVRRGACRGHPPGLARSTSPSPASSATASSCWASRARPRPGSRPACIPAWCRNRRRSRAWTACSTPWWPRATSSAASCWKAAAPGQGRPPRPWSPT